MNVAQILIEKLHQKGYTLTTAESCTGGMISSTLIDVAGASSVINECHVTYSNEAKEKYLGVSKETLEQYGAVSEQTAYEMARGAVKLANADVAIAVTGLAGPDGGTKEKPVGLVYIACNICGNIKVYRYIFDGDRMAVRQQTTMTAIWNMLEGLN